MSTSRRVYSEDDNFLIGDDFNTERLRREARQLHLSKFSRIRREAHFARYRNSFLKCDLEQRNDRIEQGRKLRLAEMERARNTILKQDKNKRKIRRESRDFIEKKTKTDPTRTAPGNENMSETENEKYESSGLSSVSLDPSRVSSMAEKRASAGRWDMTTPTKPEIQVTSSRISNVEDLSGKQDKRLSVGALSSSRSSSVAGKNDKRLSVAAFSSSRPSSVAGKDVKRLSVAALSSSRLSSVAGKDDKRLSVAAFSSSRPSSVAGKDDKRLSVAALSSSRPSSVVGKDDKRLSVAALSSSRPSSVAGKQDKTLSVAALSSSRASSVAGKQDKTLSVAALSSSRASSVAGKRDLSGKQDKTLSVAALSSLRASSVAGKQDKTLSVATMSSSRASSVAGKRDVAGNQRQMTAKTPSVQIAPSNDVGSDNRDSFESNVVVVEQAAKRENLIEVQRSAKRSRDFGLSPVEKTEENDHDNEFAEGTKERTSRMYSALLSEAASRGSGSRISRVNGGTISPALTEIQHTSTVKKAQTQSAHERWIWTEFDKIMKGFAEVLHIEHKSVNLKNSKDANAVPDKDTKPPMNTPRNPMTPLYFRYGISDRIVFRC